MSKQYLAEGDWLEAHLEDEDIRILDCMIFFHAKKGLRVQSGCDKWDRGHIIGSEIAHLRASSRIPGASCFLLIPA